MSRDKWAMSLPYPPSVNHLWLRTRRGVHLSKEGRLYKQQVAELVRTVGKPRLYERMVRVELVLYPPDARRRDLDNVLKILLDSLTYARVWHDDEQVDQISIRRGEPVKSSGQCLVKVWQLEKEWPRLESFLKARERKRWGEYAGRKEAAAKKALGDGDVCSVAGRAKGHDGGRRRKRPGGS